MKIYPAITTNKDSNWRDKFREINYLKLEEVAVFPTFLDKRERENLYQMIKDSSIKRIPLVHLREDMDIEELHFFAKKYNTQVFNTHSEREYKIDPKWTMEYKELICIENTHNSPLLEEEVKKYGGICLDFSHLENTRMLEIERYAKEQEVISKFKVRCNHISAIKKDFSFIDNEKRKLRYDSHDLEDFSELDYLKSYPVNYFSEYCAMELTNPISKQIEAIDYINSFMNERDAFIKTMID
ncbi:MAG: hypothetical protein WC909_00910 [Candidatus Paceibacterota bacterium]|jgi:hypothetical protein